MKTKYNSALSAAEASSSGQTRNNAIRRRWSALALGGFLFTSIFALSALPVAAQCQQYDVSGQWTILQGRFHIPVTLSQNGKTVSGTAFHQSKTPSNQSQVDTETRDVHGQVTGTVQGDSFNVQINWSGGGAGVYRGSISQTGRLQGTTYDKNNSSSTARWSTDHHFYCADAPAVPATNPAPPPIKKSGKVPTNPAPPPIRKTGKDKSLPTAPTIKAQPILVTIPVGQSRGRTTLTWDGGEDHPDAEVWMKGSSQEEETFVVQQGKGTRSVTVQLGQNWAFILKDAGQQIARAAVITKQ